MKWITALLVMIGVVWYVAKKTTLLDRTVEKDVTNAEELIPKAERAAESERARVNQVQSVEGVAAGQSVSVTMTRDEVRSIWGDPNAIDKDSNGTENWRYDSIGKRVVFRDGRVWVVEDL
jgi:hypothetical protein